MGEVRRSDVYFADDSESDLSSRCSSGPCPVAYRSMMRPFASCAYSPSPTAADPWLWPRFKQRKQRCAGLSFSLRSLPSSAAILKTSGPLTYKTHKKRPQYVCPFALILAVQSWREAPLLRWCSSDGRESLRVFPVLWAPFLLLRRETPSVLKCLPLRGPAV